MKPGVGVRRVLRWPNKHTYTGGFWDGGECSSCGRKTGLDDWQLRQLAPEDAVCHSSLRPASLAEVVLGPIGGTWNCYEPRPDMQRPVRILCENGQVVDKELVKRWVESRTGDWC